LYGFGRVYRHLQGNRAAEGMPDHVCSANAEMLHEVKAISGLLVHANETSHTAARRIATTVVGDQLEAASEGLV
jgi:hypothetical protein